MAKIITKKQELIVKKIEEFCTRLVKNCYEREKEEAEWNMKVSEKYGFNRKNEEVYKEGQRLFEKYRKKESNIWDILY